MNSRLRMLIVTVTAALALMVPGVASAHTGTPLTQKPTYVGWAEVLDQYGAYQFQAYQYSTTGWKSIKLAGGTPVYVYPWGSGWSWFWTQSTSWGAIPTVYVQV